MSGKLTQFKVGLGKEVPGFTSFSPVTAMYLGINLKNFLNYNLNFFYTLVQTFKTIASASPKLFNVNQKHLSKFFLFWSNHCKCRAVINSVLEMLDTPNFGHVTTSAI